MDMASDSMAWIIIGILFFLAYIGILAPVLPDVPLVVAGIAVYHFMIDDKEFGMWSWVILISLAIILVAIEYFAGGIAANRYGGSRWDIPAAVIGAILFSVIPIFGPLGIVIGPIISVFIVELMNKKTAETAFKIALTTLVGFLGGVIVKFFVMTGIIVWFFVSIWI